MNVCILSGIICKGLEFVNLKNDNLLVKGKIAVKKSFSVEEGESQYNFIRFYSFGNVAQNMQNRLNEKDIVILSGEWSINEFTLNDGKICTVNELYVTKFEITKKHQNEIGG